MELRKTYEGTIYAVIDGTSHFGLTLDAINRRDGPMARLAAEWLDAGNNITDDDVPAAPVTSVSVSPYQARVALTQAGLFDAIEAIMENENTPAEAKIAWEYALVFERHSPFIESLAPLLGLTEQQIDELFVLAASI